MSSKPLIANELLAFLKHAIDYMDEISILQICKSAFKEAEICSAKLLLFQTLGKIDQMPSRRRDGTEKSIQDIITLMKETDPDDVPDFVVKDLHKLPPITFDHVDVTRLLKDITSLKVSLAELQSKLEVSNNTICDLRAEVVLLRSAVSVTGSPDASNMNTRHGAENAAISSSLVASASPIKTASVASRATAACASTPVQVQACVGTLTPKRAYADIVADNQTESSQKKQAANIKRGQANQPSLKKDKHDNEGFIKVERKKKPLCRNQCGTALAGPNMLLRPATPTTLLYVSRLHHSTKAEDVVEYLRVKTNWILRVEKLESRHNINFKSFVVRVPTHDLETFLKEQFWPKGIVYRRFRGRLRDTSQRNTTPSLRVQ
ncbi:uncharacterized protein LOC111365127 [Spodoptera litura]|uniref:Uncharacterized protein LOC111354381 n=1 Tax=Spodoptera litura TaxID=69820 RepID=A0A9J7EYK9_SPOLT|nr:uncharacterized protein LOC111354381 [Spodoptera litura]XP_022833270.1 uncharacterized protein LOC111361123 [Spodoptera litura]XP_022838094.1 uncharacterized protein LOC111365127 [Spodoptera litura]